MGFDKRFVNKEIIEIKLKELEALLNADALIIQDEWSENFIIGYDTLKKELEIWNVRFNS